jgi:hypothetical protein
MTAGSFAGGASSMSSSSSAALTAGSFVLILAASSAGGRSHASRASRKGAERHSAPPRADMAVRLCTRAVE